MMRNIFKHWKTTVGGLLLGGAQIASVFLAHGVGPTNYISLGVGVATVLGGMISRDPKDSTAPVPGSTAKLGCWMLIALLLPLPFVEGCNTQTVAQDIVNWTPALQSAVATVDSSAALIDPADAAIYSSATATFDAASNLLAAQAKAYLARPTATILAQLQTQVVTFQQQVNAALLQAAKITNPTSQQHALNSINAVATIVNSILALVVSISSKAQVAAMSAAAPVKLAEVIKVADPEISLRVIQAHYGEALDQPNTTSAGGVYLAGIDLLQNAGF